jgi:hypothetical protein
MDRRSLIFGVVYLVSLFTPPCVKPASSEGAAMEVIGGTRSAAAH